jgi:hypothetical protein
MIEDAERTGLGLAALALSTASIAAELREERLTEERAQAIFADARALVSDRAGFLLDPETARMAKEFLSIAEALAQPNAPRVR